jgi:tetratricopeptide (TPR) repeat protein
MRWLPILICGVGLTAAQAPAAEAVPDDRTAIYREFRNAFDHGNFNAALPLAVQIVERTRNQFGADAPELANPLGNLATTYLRRREFGPALDSYREMVKVLELQGDTANVNLIAPLHGLGLALQGLGRDDEAIVPLKRAVDITRNRNGLRAVAQLPMLNALVDSYVKTARNEEASREHQYAYTVAENSYGSEDLRLLGPLDRLARWQESMGRYTAARALYLREVEIADLKEANSLKAIDGLRGIARTYRLAFVNGETQDALLSADDLPGTLSSSRARMLASQSSGSEQPLREALQRLDKSPGDHAALRGAVLIDLGDFYLVGRSVANSLAAYKDAWRTLERTGETSALATPVAVMYLAPPMAISRVRESPDEYTEQTVELRVSIAANGDVRGVTVANPAPERENAERATITAVRRAVWRPAFSNGEAVAATDFIFRERVNIRRAKAN